MKCYIIFELVFMISVLSYLLFFRQIETDVVSLSFIGFITIAWGSLMVGVHKQKYAAVTCALILLILHFIHSLFALVHNINPLTVA